MAQLQPASRTTSNAGSERVKFIWVPYSYTFFSVPSSYSASKNSMNASTRTSSHPRYSRTMFHCVSRTVMFHSSTSSLYLSALQAWMYLPDAVFAWYSRVTKIRFGRASPYRRAAVTQTMRTLFTNMISPEIRMVPSPSAAKASHVLLVNQQPRCLYWRYSCRPLRKTSSMANGVFWLVSSV